MTATENDGVPDPASGEHQQGESHVRLRPCRMRLPVAAQVGHRPGLRAPLPPMYLSDPNCRVNGDNLALAGPCIHRPDGLDHVVSRAGCGGIGIAEGDDFRLRYCHVQPPERLSCRPSRYGLVRDEAGEKVAALFQRKRAGLPRLHHGIEVGKVGLDQPCHRMPYGAICGGLRGRCDNAAARSVVDLREVGVIWPDRQRDPLGLVVGDADAPARCPRWQALA